MTTAVHQPSRNCHLQGCDSPECALANYRYMAALRLDHHRGIRRLRDAAPVLEHIQRLLANDWLVRQIADASGVSMSAVRYVLYGQPTISRARAAAILSIPIGPPPADPTVVDVTGTIRRLRALACLGHTLDDIGAEIGISRWRLGRIITGTYPEIDTETADKIAHVYQRLSTFRGNNPHTIRRARAQGWHGPLAWDDIDDPHEQLEESSVRALNFRERAALRREEIIHLAWCGHDVEQILERLDNEVSISTVRQIVQEWRTGQKRDRTQQEKTAKAGLEAAA